MVRLTIFNDNTYHVILGSIIMCKMYLYLLNKVKSGTNLANSKVMRREQNFLLKMRKSKMQTNRHLRMPVDEIINNLQFISL